MKKKDIKQIAVQAGINVSYMAACFVLFIGIFFLNISSIVGFVNDFNSEIESNYAVVQESDLATGVYDVSFAQEAAISLLFVFGMFFLCMLILYVFRGVQHKEWKKNAFVCIGGFFLFIVISFISLFIQVQQPVLFSSTIMQFITLVLQIALWSLYLYLFIYSSWWIKKKKYSFSYYKLYVVYFLIALLPILLIQEVATGILSFLLLLVLHSYMQVMQKPF